ncbi:MAG: hypothetical protein WCB79_01310 [Halobacteriota archaeon]
MRDTLNVRTTVELVEKGTIARTEGKSKKVIDLLGALQTSRSDHHATSSLIISNARLMSS